MSEADIRANVIADNRQAENTGWDRQLLGIEFKYLADLDFDFDLILTGFELPEIDALISGVGVEEPDPADDVPEPQAGSPVTRLGDIWQIGRHRQICGDAPDGATYDNG